jgi:hypothetical protein
MSRRGMASDPLQCGIQIGHIDDAESAKKFFRLGIRPSWTRVSVAQRYRRRRLWRVESRAADKDARCLKSFTISSSSCYRGVITAIERFLRLIDKHCLFHNVSFLLSLLSQRNVPMAS